MIKRIMIVCCMILNASYCQAQLGDKIHKEVALEDIPLLFQFDRLQAIVTVSALTQSWVKVSDALQKKAAYLIEPVAQEIVRQIAGNVISGSTYLYVKNSDGLVCKYDTQNKHKDYFLQELCTMRYIKGNNSLEIVR